LRLITFRQALNRALFDVAARRPWGHAEKVFASEAEASVGLANLVAEATR